MKITFFIWNILLAILIIISTIQVVTKIFFTPKPESNYFFDDSDGHRVFLENDICESLSQMDKELNTLIQELKDEENHRTNVNNSI